MEKLIVSMMRFSTAVTLFGMEQLQTAMNTMTGTEDVSHSVERFRRALDSLTDSVVKQIDDAKKDTVDSMTQMSENAVHRTFEGMNMAMMDPRQMMQATTDLMKKTTDSMASWVSSETQKTASETRSEEPKKAAEALSKTEGAKK